MIYEVIFPDLQQLIYLTMHLFVKNSINFMVIFSHELKQDVRWRIRIII